MVSIAFDCAFIVSRRSMTSASLSCADTVAAPQASAMVRALAATALAMMRFMVLSLSAFDCARSSGCPPGALRRGTYHRSPSMHAAFLFRHGEFIRPCGRLRDGTQNVLAVPRALAEARVIFGEVRELRSLDRVFVPAMHEDAETDIAQRQLG